MNIQHPESPYFVMPTFRELRELAKVDREKFNDFKALFRECK